MKQIVYKIIVCCTLLALNLPGAFAQEARITGSDSGSDSLGVSDPLIQVAFRAVNPENLPAGVAVMDITDLMKKSYALSSLGYLDNVVGGVNGSGIWGMGTDYLVLVDGFPRDANNVLPTEIEQVTVLKGAAAVVLYGSRAVKGVIMITTKRGKAGDRRINIRANTGLHTPKVYPKYVGSAEYMTLYNEARVNDGLTPLYSEEDIYNHGSGLNPYRYPDLNFYSSDYLRKAYNQSEAMAEITGGNKLARFYTTVGYYNSKSQLKVGNTKDDYISRFFARGNIDLSLHELITANIDANATFYDARNAITDFWNGAATLRPNRVSPLIPLSYLEENDAPSWALVNASNYIIGGNYFLGGTQLDPTNPIAAAYAAGESKYVSRQFQFNAGVNLNLRDILNGLFFRTKYGIDYAGTYNLAYTNNYATYTPSWTNYAGTDRIATLTKYGEDRKTGNQDISSTAYRSTNFFSGQFDYTQVINSDHNLFVLLVVNGWQRQVNEQYHRISNANLGFQLSYNYGHKYYADFSAATPYSAKFPDKNRTAFSPTATLGWRLSKEAFLKESTVVDDLMLNVSGGILNQDLDIRTDDNEMGYYLYETILQTGGWWSTGGDVGGESATEFQRGANPNLTYVKRKEINVGLRGSMWNKLLTFDLNYFSTRMDGGITRPTSIYPWYFVQNGYPSSSIIPYVNYNIDDRSGLDLSLYFNKKIDNVDLTLGVSGLYYKATAVRRDENYAYDYQSRMNRPLNSLWGLESLGFFKDPADIEQSPTQQFGTVKPGDIKYKDQNGDNIIDNNDEVLLGRWEAPLTLGINLTAKWNNFTFFAMGNAYSGAQGMKNSSYYWVRSDGKYSEIVRNRWTEAAKETATYPRLTTTSGDNNFRSSDFWMYDSNRFTLSQVQFTYDVPRSFLSSNFAKELSIYVGGYNLLTIAKEQKHLEMTVGGAPQTRFYNLGVKAVF
jgi:TonB-linked SusC/RagA family outer membrane protein